MSIEEMIKLMEIPIINPINITRKETINIPGIHFFNTSSLLISIITTKEKNYKN